MVKTILQVGPFQRGQANNGAALLEPLRLFSDWGMVVVAVLVITGLINALSILAVSAGTLHEAYAKVLLAKVALASVMIALAMLNRWGVTPSMRGGDSKATDSLVRYVAAEIALGLTIISVIGYLGLMPPH